MAADVPLRRIVAPWTPEQVEGLSRWQVEKHPFTCHNRKDGEHRYAPEVADFGVLVPTPNGWVCRDCDYTQDWAHPDMVLPELPPWEATRSKPESCGAFRRHPQDGYCIGCGWDSASHASKRPGRAYDDGD